MTVVRTLDFRNHKPDSRPVLFELDTNIPSLGGVKNIFNRFGIHIHEAETLQDGESSHRLRVKVIETPRTTAEERLNAAKEVLLKTMPGFEENRRERFE